MFALMLAFSFSLFVLSLSLSLRKTKPTLKSLGPNVLIGYPSASALPLPQLR